MRPRALMAGLVLVVAVAACNGNGTSDSAMAKKACDREVPTAPGATPPETGSVGSVIDGYTAAGDLAAKAAAKNVRWERLSTAYSTLVDAWSAVAGVVGRNADANPMTRAVDYSTQVQFDAVVHDWNSRASAAESTIRAECRVAAAS